MGYYVDPNVKIQFTGQPQDQPGILPSPAARIVTVDFPAGDGGFTVENSNPEPPGPWLYDPAQGHWLARGSNPSGCGEPYSSALFSRPTRWRTTARSC